MEGGDRSARAAAAAAAATKKKKNGNDGIGMAWSGDASRVAVPLDQVLATSEALRARLAQLGATAPRFVIGKPLMMSDVHRNQARLLLSCKRASLARCPLTACFTGQEMRLVEDKGSGLLVTALDRGGGSYDLTCKYLDSNHGYRFITGWKDFLDAIGLELDDDGKLQRDVHVELWAFRSRALPNRLLGKDKKKTYEETGHPDGALGLVLLHYDYGVRDGDDREEEGMDDTSAAAPPVKQQEKNVAGAGTEQQPESGARTTMTKDEMVNMFGEKIASAAIGMNMLRAFYSDRRNMDTSP